MSASFRLDIDEDARRMSVLAELDRTNVFEDSPTAVVLTIEGKPTLAGDEQQAVTCGPIMISIDIPDADAVAVLKLSEAAALRDALTELLKEAGA